MKLSAFVIQASLHRILREQLGLGPDSPILPTDHLAKDLGADSLDMVEIVMEIETTFAIDIPDETADTLTTVQDLLTLIANERN